MMFLNQEKPIGWMPAWDRTSVPKLWSYHLHYFDWMWAFGGDGLSDVKPL